MFTENAPIIERSLNCKISNILLRIEFIIFKFEMLVAFIQSSIMYLHDNSNKKIAIPILYLIFGYLY